jgi:hypothetical protein
MLIFLLFISRKKPGDHLAYLDPHYMRTSKTNSVSYKDGEFLNFCPSKAIETKDTASYTMGDLESYHCSAVRLVSVDSIDPSMVFGFYCKDEQAVDTFSVRMQQVCKCIIFS